MGLDMYAYSVAKNGDPEGGEVEKEEIAYWRKFNALHGWMEQLYRDKGGSAQSFNCIPVQLTREDLAQLAVDVTQKNLKPTEGFFFGAQTIYPEDIEATMTFIGKAIAEMERGKDVYYDSWW